MPTYKSSTCHSHPIHTPRIAKLSQPNDTRTAAITADAARIRTEHALKLRVINHKYAGQITAHARAVECYAAKIKAEAIAIAGPDHDEHHSVRFEEYGSIAEQQADNEGCSSVDGAGLVDVVELATPWPIVQTM